MAPFIAIFMRGYYIFAALGLFYFFVLGLLTIPVVQNK